MSLTKDLSAVRVEHVNLCDDLDVMTALVRRMKHNVRNFLSTVSTEVQKMYDEMVHVVIRKIQDDLVGG